MWLHPLSFSPPAEADCRITTAARGPGCASIVEMATVSVNVQAQQCRGHVTDLRLPGLASLPHAERV
jgi:hypothetical protein